MRKIEKRKMSKKMKQRLLILCLETAGIIGFVVAVIMFIARLNAVANGEVPVGADRLGQDIVAISFAVGGMLSFIALSCLGCE